jgi:hypothetical protein
MFVVTNRRWEVRWECNGNIRMFGNRSDGSEPVILDTTPGKTGQTPAALPAGQYKIDVQSDGYWTVTVLDSL